MQTQAKLPREENSPRSLEGVFNAPSVHWVGDGFRVAGYFSKIPQAMRRLSPFLMLDYHAPFEYGPSERPRGVGVHPHRGFETVTIAWQGSVAHHDSAGGGGVIGPGDVQWMTAGSGVLHKEYHAADFTAAGGTFHMAQLWVNLPRTHKMTAPRYQAITRDEITEVPLAEGGGVVRIIAGTFNGHRGPAQTHTPVGLFDVRLEPGGRLPLVLPAHHNCGVLVMEGTVRVQGQTDAKTGDFIVSRPDGTRLEIEATSQAQLLVLSGEPIDEPIAQYGPFVMNTKEEIVQAFHDYELGKFGVLADA